MKNVQAHGTPDAAPSGREVWRTWLIRALVVGVVAGLLFLALRDAPVLAIWAVMRRLQAWQVALVLGIDVLIYVLVSARWWLIVHAEDATVDFLPLIGVRLAVFAVSYFTVGPQVGGEPLQVLYLRRQYGTTYARATASVILDKLLELLANFVFLVLGFGAGVQSGLLRRVGGLAPWHMIALLVLLAWPAVHVLMLMRGRYPISALLGIMPGVRHDGRPARYVRASEHLAGQFCRRHAGTLLTAIGISLLACAAAVIEYRFIASFLGVNLSAPQIVVAWTVGWLSFLVPVPGGLGALEAGQVLALGAFGVSQAAAIGIALAMRGRDLLAGGIGTLWGARLVVQSKSRSADVLHAVEVSANQPASWEPGAAKPKTDWENTNE